MNSPIDYFPVDLNQRGEENVWSALNETLKKVRPMLWIQLCEGNSHHLSDLAGDEVGTESCVLACFYQGDFETIEGHKSVRGVEAFGLCFQNEEEEEDDLKNDEWVAKF